MNELKEEKQKANELRKECENWCLVLKFDRRYY